MTRDRVQRGGECGLRLEQDGGVEQPGRSRGRVAQRRLVPQHDDRVGPRGPATTVVALGDEHLKRHDVAVVRGHAVEVADEQRDRAHGGVGGDPILIHTNENRHPTVRFPAAFRLVRCARSLNDRGRCARSTTGGRCARSTTGTLRSLAQRPGDAALAQRPGPVVERAKRVETQERAALLRVAAELADGGDRAAVVGAGAGASGRPRCRGGRSRAPRPCRGRSRRAGSRPTAW